MRKLMQASVMIAMWGCLSSTAVADSKKVWRPDAGRGLKLSDRLCSGCHIVSPNQKRDAIAGIPTFRAIANLPGRTDRHVGNTLIQPHRPMPNTQLTQREIADLLAYFGTLREVKPGTPAKQNKDPSRSKPVYPSAS
jgi:mono/diheme cytochrome c family protein